MPLVELIYEKNCPNIEITRIRILQAFENLEMKPDWCEWEVKNASTPLYARQYGSPTILINGKDIDSSSMPVNPGQCRLYSQPDDSLGGVPPIHLITSALESPVTNDSPRKFSAEKLRLAVLPGIFIAFLPKLVCPFCWPLYTGLLGTIGVNFINYSPLLFPLLTLFLLLTICGLVLAARSKNSFGPVYLGVFSALVIMSGKFLFEINVLVISGIIGLILSIVWQAGSTKQVRFNTCSICERTRQ